MCYRCVRIVSQNANKPIQLVNVWMEDLVHEADTRGLEWVLVRKFYVDLPNSTREGS